MSKGIIICFILLIISVGIGAFLINRNNTQNSSSSSYNNLSEISSEISSDDSTETPLADEELAVVEDSEPYTLDVGMSGSKFTPAKIKIKTGESVTWTNNDSVPHTVSATDNLFNSGTLTRSQIFQNNFTAPRVYNYYCELHGVSESGTVIVE